jgi:8-oxo-dGTP pyrophosphatase MutT (NUDIX family)
LITAITRLKLSIHTNPGHQRSDLVSANLPKAAVGVILAPDLHEQELTALFVKRKKSATDPWSGHMAFPGGRLKDGEDLFQTVRREVLEETSIDIQTHEFFGKLDEQPTGNKSVMVSPFVFFASAQINAIIETRELEDYVWIPISFFSDKANIQKMRVEMLGMHHDVLSFHYQNSYVVWGVTLRIIDDLLCRI